jgi:hypothetical protein
LRLHEGAFDPRSGWDLAAPTDQCASPAAPGAVRACKPSEPRRPSGGGTAHAGRPKGQGDSVGTAPSVSRPAKEPSEPKGQAAPVASDQGSPVSPKAASGHCPSKPAGH